ncbi:unnamed protein product [Vitrella brassicaformis CCMP3155]|uniref:Uncharacterized protein n=1 Tax=Vitrella brassicaformis (strain CCMP3155) TaxID=1169540 RepID=A0A0G4EK40_VITBC|nr:unnamed protein product [Vitrella brassicaformis CCMP3155]|eukprot:CEL96913.1 unnamed protein product [Vitrella brassicaformis CCMP3155]
MEKYTIGSIFEAVEAGNKHSVAHLITQGEIEILNTRDKVLGHTPFIAAARNGDVDIMSVMYDRYGPPILEQTGLLGSTSFIDAAYKGDVAAMKAMFAKRKDLLTQKDNHGNTALHQAALWDRTEAVSQLCDWCAPLDVKNNNGQTPWDIGAQKPSIRKVMEKYKQQGGLHVNKLSFSKTREKSPLVVLAGGDKYEGEWVGGVFDGYGVLERPDGQKYEGQVKDNQYNGTGKLTDRSGFVYEGDFKDGRYHGKGKYTYANGSSYEDDWTENMYGGYGVESLADGSIYKGCFKGGKRNGEGVITWPDGGCYKGHFHEGKKHGWGKFSWPGGNSYEGEWKDGERHGKGTYTHANGSRYEGDWVEDKQEGYGIEKYSSGQTFKGYYKGNKKNGKGMCTWPDGKTYEGQFINDDIHGEGTYKWADGRLYKGQWAQNHMHGSGTYRWPDGRCHEGQYNEDKKHGWGKFSWPGCNSYEDGKQHGKGKYTDKEGVTREGIWECGQFKEWLTEKEPQEGHGSRPASPQPPNIKFTNIFEAVKAGDAQSVVRLLIEDMGILEKRNEFGYSPFLVAAEKGQVAVMEAMYEKQQSILQQSDKIGITAMDLAAINSQVAAIEFLLRCGGSELLDARSRLGMTSLMRAARYGHVDVLKVMFDTKGRDILVHQDNTGETALHEAAKRGHESAVRFLLEVGDASLLEIKDNLGETPWDEAKAKPEIRTLMQTYRTSAQGNIHGLESRESPQASLASIGLAQKVLDGFETILKIDSGESRARLAELVVDALKNVQDYLANLDEKKTKAAAKELFRKAMRPARDCILNLDPEFVVKKFLSIIDRANTRLQQLAATIDSKDLGHLNQMPVQLTLKARGKIEEAWQTSGEETLHHSLESLICLGIELARELLRAFDSEQRMCDRDEIKPVCGALVAKGLEVVREVAKQMNVPQEDLTEIVEYASTMPDMVAAWLPDVELWDADEADTKLKDVTEGM